jgi:hypothetical protein
MLYLILLQLKRFSKSVSLQILARIIFGLPPLQDDSLLRQPTSSLLALAPMMLPLLFCHAFKSLFGNFKWGKLAFPPTNYHALTICLNELLILHYTSHELQFHYQRPPTVSQICQT